MFLILSSFTTPATKYLPLSLGSLQYHGIKLDQIKFYRIIKMGGGALKLSLVPLSGGENLSLYVQDFFKRELRTTFKVHLRYLFALLASFLSQEIELWPQTC